MGGKHKEGSCKICYKTMRSADLKRHMKVHEKLNKQICDEDLDGTLDKMFAQAESTTEIKLDEGEHDAANCQPTKKRKFIEIDDKALEKILEEQTVEYDRKIAFKIALGKEVDEILGRGKVKQAALSKDMHGALCLYRHSINNRRNVEIDTDN